MNKSLYHKNVETTNYFPGLEKRRGTMLDAAEEYMTTSATPEFLFVKKEGFPASPFHVTKNDSWC